MKKKENLQTNKKTLDSSPTQDLPNEMNEDSQEESTQHQDQKSSSQTEVEKGDKTSSISPEENCSEEENEEPKDLSDQDKIERLGRELKESNEKILRTRAEFDNYRKRMQRELTEVRSFSKMSVIEEILPVMDHFKMALSASENSDNFDTLKEGITLILAEFDRCFKNLGIEEVPTTGQSFDPTIHEAISTESSPEIEEGYIIKKWKSGYKLGEKLLRPASVVVSSGPEENHEEEKK